MYFFESELSAAGQYGDEQAKCYEHDDHQALDTGLYGQTAAEIK